jgi:hypothetical protein
MTRIARITTAGLVVFAGVGTQPAFAGLFDELKEKVQDAASQIANEEAGKVVPEMPPTNAGGTAGASGGTQATRAFTNETGVPTTVARELLVVRFRPEVLDDEFRLKRIAGNVDPNRRSWMNTDQFRWRKERDAIKAELLEQAKDVPTTFEITPWPGRVVMADLGPYDFSRKAFKMRVHTGASGGWPWGGDNRLQWLAVPEDVAEKMVSAFGNKTHWVYAKYSLKVAGVEPKGSGNRTYAFFDDRIDKIDVYTLNGSPFPTSPEDFVYRVSLDTSKLRMKDHAGRR